MSVCTVPVPVPATGFLLFTHSQSGTERLLPVGHHSARVVVRHNHRLCLSLDGAGNENLGKKDRQKTYKK